MNAVTSRIRGGFSTLIVIILVLVADIWISKAFPTLKTAACCSPKEHVADLIAASGVAVAFVLTYLSSLSALPSPGRQLLSSALFRIRHQEPYLAAIDAEGRIPPEEFGRLEQFLDNALDLAPNDEDVLNAYMLFMHIVGLAKPQQVRIETSTEQLEKLGYSHLRAEFLTSIVFKQDAEKRLLLRATILCAIIFSYTALIYCLELVGVIESSAVMLLGYPLLAFVGGGFAVALALRMWLHEVRDEAIGSIINLLEQTMQKKVARSAQALDLVIAEAREKYAARTGSHETSMVTPEMISEGERQLSAAMQASSSEVVRNVFSAMYVVGRQQGRI